MNMNMNRLFNRSTLQDIEWQMLEAEKEGDIEKANRILGEFEATHPGLLATRMHCEVFFYREIFIHRHLLQIFSIMIQKHNLIHML